MKLFRILLVPMLWCLVSPPSRAAEPVTHRVLAADRSKGKLAIIDPSGKIEWEMPLRHDVHDLHLLPNGNILTHTTNTNVVEITPQKTIAWEYVAKPKPGYTGRIEIHSFQRLPDGNTMVAESGNSRIVEVNPAGEIVKTIALDVKKPDAHRDTRMVRKLASGNYLVCQESEGAVKEYNPEGKVVWSYTLDLAGRPRSGGHGPEGHGIEVYGAVRLASGNTLIAGGNNNRVIEVNPKGEIVWKLDQTELPGITLAWVTTLQVLPNGNIIIGNCHGTKANPQLIEITREKQVVWTFKNFDIFGDNLASAIVLDLGPGVIR